MSPELKQYLIYGVLALAAWLMFTRPMTEAEMQRSQVYRLFCNVVSLAVAGACCWFVWWVAINHCGGGGC